MKNRTKPAVSLIIMAIVSCATVEVLSHNLSFAEDEAFSDPAFNSCVAAAYDTAKGNPAGTTPNVAAIPEGGLQEITGGLSCKNMGIVSVSGIEQLTGLNAFLSLEGNQISSIDLSQNTAITGLSVTNNNLSSLDVSNKPELLEVYAEGNNLASTSVNLTNTPKLIYIYIADNAGVTVSVPASTLNDGRIQLDLSDLTFISTIQTNGNYTIEGKKVISTQAGVVPTPRVVPTDSGYVYNLNITYTVSAAVDTTGNYGEVAIDGSTTVDAGTTYTISDNIITLGNGATITATPNTADATYTYSFDSWSITGSDNGTILADTTFTAVFTREEIEDDDDEGEDEGEEDDDSPAVPNTGSIFNDMGGLKAVVILPVIVVAIIIASVIAKFRKNKQ